MQFAQPLWLAAGLLSCALLVWRYRRFDASQRAALTKFAAARLLPKLTLSISTPRRRLKRGLVLAGVALLFTALARPQAGFEMRETHRKGLELVFAIDTSKSMLAQDVKPDRLTRAKLGVTDLVARLQGDGVGVIAFAGNAFLQCPVTLDYDAFRESLNAIDTSSIPLGGTNIAAAIREAEAVFEERSPAEKILVLLTDGEDLGGDGITAAEAAAKKGVKIFTVGVGNASGELVPVPAAAGGTEFARDDKGQLVKSRLDETTLKKIAEVTGGMYQPLGSQVEGLNAVYDQGLAKMNRGDLSSRQAKVPLERFQWPLLAALLCFVTDWVIGNRRRASADNKPEPPPAAPVRKKLPSPPPRAMASTSAATAGVSAVLALMAVCSPVSSRAAATPQDAEQAYQKGDYAKAHQDYAATAAQQPAKPELQFNTGSAAYKAGDYAQAVNGFQESLKSAPVAVQQDAYYNLGNTQYRLGQKTLKEKPEETIRTWEEAVKSYEAALQINPSDSAARHNRDLVKRKIEQLKKQQEQKKDDQENKDDKKDPKDKKDDKDDKDKKDSKDNKDQDSKDHQGKDSKDQQGGDKEKDSKEDPSKEDGQKKPEDSKDQKDSDKQAGKDQEKKDEAKDQEKKDAADGKEQGKDKEKKDEAKDGQKAGQDQPKPVNPDKKPQQGDIQPADGTKPPDAADPAAGDRVRLAPGQMTREEARQLLEALKSDERKVPAISAQGRAGTPPKDGKTIKDW